jgi:APA family basic amino acid/polyamine antiporter
MAFGVISYVIYRRYVERTSLTKVVRVPAEALHKDTAPAEFETILVPVFGTQLDDDIMSTAGRLADAALDPGEERPRLEVIYVMDLPLSVPLDSLPPKDRQETANRALARAAQVGEEYETVDVDTAVVRARTIGAGIVEEARRRNVELIVMGGEPPSKVRGGEALGGSGPVLPPEIGQVTQYVLSKAPCRVLITAPAASAPAGADGAGAPDG